MGGLYSFCVTGGLLLGLLGLLGGHLTLFEGLDEVKELGVDPSGWSAGQFAAMAVVKTAALVIAATCGFRGGRIFPAVFVGVALGLCAHALVAAVPLALAVPSTVLGGPAGRHPAGSEPDHGGGAGQ